MSLISEAPRDLSQSEAPHAEDSTAAPQVSIVMPCLNEAETLAACSVSRSGRNPCWVQRMPRAGRGTVRLGERGQKPSEHGPHA